MPPTMIANRPELAVLRSKIPGALDEFVRTLGDPRYAAAIERFLGAAPSEDAPWNYAGTLSPNTRRAYVSALEEFFEWLAREYGQVVPPERVMTADVERYVQWLSRPTYTLRSEKLRDGDQPLRLAIYETLERIGASNLETIYAALPGAVVRGQDSDQERAALSHELGRMVLHDNLIRDPTMDDLRQYVPSAGIRVFRIAKLDDGTYADPAEDRARGAKVVDMDELFIYRVPSPRPISRRSVVSRLTALSSFWESLKQGENVPGSEAVLQHNVIRPVLKRVSRGMAQQIKQISRAQKPDPRAVIKLMRVTDSPRTLGEMRNRALLLFLLLTGVRVEEAVALRRGPDSSSVANYAGWLEPDDPPRVRLLRKGGRTQILPYPPMAFEALRQFQNRLAEVAPPLDAQSSDPKARRYIQPDSRRWRYAELAHSPSAPLFPSLYLWGANSAENYTRLKPNPQLAADQPLSRHAVYSMLKSLAEKAGLTPEQKDRIHPHALRHFAAVAMFQGGKSLIEIQEMLGHESVTTTERYIQRLVTTIEHSGQNEIMSYLRQFEDVPERSPEPSERLRPVVKTHGEPISEPRPAPPPESPREERQPGAVRPRPSAVRRTEAPAEAPQVAKIVDAVEETATLLPSPPLPANDLPVVPEPTEEPIEMVLTAQGPAVEQDNQLIAIGGEPAEGTPPRMLDNRSSGSPDYVYAALAELGASTAIAELGRATREFNRAKKAQDEQKKSQAREQQRAARKMLAATGYDPVEWTVLTAQGSRGKKRAGKTIEIEKGSPKVQKNAWLLEHYDPWPLHYGIGHDSLLVWYAKGQATAEGYVVEGSVVVPPVPVLSPEQIDPQTDYGARVLECAERIYSEWMDGKPDEGIGPSPTRAFGLVRWYGFLSFITGQLQRHAEKTELKLRWQPFNTVCELGKDVRAHDDDWICQWLHQNAHTYITSIRAFESVSRGRGAEDEAFWRDLSIATFQGRKVDDNLPEWFADDDPVHAIYKRSVKEWEQFSDWIGSVTGQQLSAERRHQRSEQRKFVKREIKVSREVLEGELDLYYDAVDVFAAPAGTEIKTAAFGTVLVDQDQRSMAKLTRDTYEKEFERKYGIELQNPELTKLSRPERIRTLIAEAFPEGPGAESKEGMEQSKNTLGDSKLFDPRYFRLDRSGRTITHTQEFRQEFLETYGQDSELVLRRAARAMWEYARENAKLLDGKLTASEYSYLYSMMLAYVSWVIPAGDEMERQIRQRSPGAVQGRPARLRWIASQGEAMRALIYAAKPLDIGDLEQRSEETREQWAERIVVLLREQLPAGAPERDLIDAGNSLAIYQHMLMGDAMAAEEQASAELEQRSLLGEIAGEAGMGRVVAPRAGREARAEFAASRKAHTPNYSGRRGDYDMVMTYEHWRRASRYLRNAELVLPSPFSMIRAMSQAPGARRGILGGLFR